MVKIINLLNRQITGILAQGTLQIIKGGHLRQDVIHIRSIPNTVHWNVI